VGDPALLPLPDAQEEVLPEEKEGRLGGEEEIRRKESNIRSKCVTFSSPFPRPPALLLFRVLPFRARTSSAWLARTAMIAMEAVVIFMIGDVQFKEKVS